MGPGELRETAAGALLIRESGGMVSDWSGGSPAVHAALRDIAAESLP